MGVSLRDILIGRELELDQLSGKVIAVDAPNTLHQFLSTIRTPTGQPLMDRTGRITSHLMGLLTRCTALLRLDIKQIFVFDGVPPELKSETISARAAARERAQQCFSQALAAGQLEQARKFAARTSRLSQEIISSSRELLHALGIPTLQAAGEAEAQCAELVKTGVAWAAASQDYDTLLYGCPRLIQNLSVSPRKKRGLVRPRLIELAENLNLLGIDLQQLRKLAVLVGTDYNPGIAGIGPKRALSLVRGSKVQLTPELERVLEIFEAPAVLRPEIVWPKQNLSRLLNFLEGYGFDRQRVVKLLKPFGQQRLCG